MPRFPAGGEPKYAERERERAATAAAQAPIPPHRAEEERDRDQAADEVVARRRAGLRLDKAVIDDMAHDQHHGSHEQSRLAAPPGAEPRHTGAEADKHGRRRRGGGRTHAPNVSPRRGAAVEG